MDDSIFRNKITTINAKWDQRIKSTKNNLVSVEQKLASLGTPAPGALPPVMSAGQQMERRNLELQLQNLVKQFNADSKAWLAELLKVEMPANQVGLKQRIPWPNWVPEKGKDYLMRAIDQEGIPVTDRVTITKPPGTWQGIGIEWKW